MPVQIIDEIKNRTYKKNLYATDVVVRSAHARNNLGVERKIREFSCIDSLQESGELKEKVKSFERAKNMIGTNCIGRESLLYGHIQALYEYAGLSMNKPLVLPKIEHGVNFSESAVEKMEIFSHPNLVFQGAYKKHMIHSVNPLKPVFCIGPYIHYAADYYTEEQIESIRRKNGKTLLVFPTHSYEASSMDYDLSAFVDNVMDGIAKSYNTVLVSGYWLNLNSRVYELFESRGAKIVSAGARFDPNFLKRLRTMIRLADAVASNDIGTHIGYSLSLGKSFEKIPSKIVKRDSSRLTASEAIQMDFNDRQFTGAFGSGLEPDKSRQDDLFRKFWGGSGLLKSPEEMRCLIGLAQHHLEMSKGHINRYNASILKIYNDLQQSDTASQAMQFRLLRDALGESTWRTR
ncbi:hypothetical protein ACTL32_01335 [Planococcus sp. FY231025]|uniref:hypothetical protein n=1 Tax=Planococcus sp. FY231025 TaxID=3455699 RepID=UPI003F8DA2EC